MRARAVIVILSAAMLGAASIASAQSIPASALCASNEVGMPCGGNPYNACIPTICWTTVDMLNDAGEDAGVLTDCRECTACIQAGCFVTGCPAGSICTAFGGNPTFPGIGWGPTSNPDELSIATPDYICVDGGPQVLYPPTCPNPGVAPAEGGPAPSPSGSSGGSGDGSSGSNGPASAPDAGVATYAPSYSAPAAAPAGGGGAASQIVDASAPPLAPAAAPPHYTVLGHGACTMARGPAGSGGATLAGIALGLLALRRKRLSPR